MEVLAREDGAFVEAEEAYFRVTDLAREYYDAEMRASLLSRLAEETGGIHYTPETASTLAEDISFTESGTTVIEQHELWNMPVLFLLLVVLVSGEWGYRRYRGLA